MNSYKKLSKDEINEMHLIKYDGKIRVISSKDNV